MMRYLGIVALTFCVPTCLIAQVRDRNAVPPASAPAGQQGPPFGGPPPNAMFDAIDSNNDGSISTRELRKAATALRKLDMDKDGKITRAEALGGQPGDPGAMVDRLLQNDRDGDGKLSPDELPRPLAQRLGRADTNGDGLLDRAELEAAMNDGRGQFGPRGGPMQQAPDLMQYDRNNDGQLTPDEVPRQMMGMLRGADQNKDGTLDAREVQSVEQRMQERAGQQRRLPPGVQVGPQGVEAPR